MALYSQRRVQGGSAAEGEPGNVKAAKGKDRVFILAAPGESGRDFLAEEAGEQGQELAIRFEYCPATLCDWPDEAREGKTKPPAQKELITLATRRVLSVADAALVSYKLNLTRKTVKEIEQGLSDPSVTLESFIVSNTPSHEMRRHWSMDKKAMQKHHIVFQEEDADSYVQTMLGVVRGEGCVPQGLARPPATRLGRRQRPAVARVQAPRLSPTSLLNLSGLRASGKRH